jgi:cyclopropane-fatty-acyl-phospholipid synthase
MATRKEIEATYDYMDAIFKDSIGENADITCAMFNGNFSLTLEEAQKAKHQYILNGINFKPGDKVLDIGCGWGPVLKAVKEAGGKGIGITLSTAQAKSCNNSGLQVNIMDWKKLTPDTFGKFDGIVSVGAFEHFCSLENLREQKQEEVYRNFFRVCANLLPKGGRLYLQTMMWGKRVPSPEEANTKSTKLSEQWILGHLKEFYPGSWLPDGLTQIENCAEPYFKLISENNGKADYIQTMKEWGKRLEKFTFKKMFYSISLLPKYLFNKKFRIQITSLRYSCNRLCFEKQIMDHQRMVFEVC